MLQKQKQEIRTKKNAGKQWGEPPEYEYMEIFENYGLVRKGSSFMMQERDQLVAQENVRFF